MCQIRHARRSLEGGTIVRERKLGRWLLLLAWLGGGVRDMGDSFRGRFRICIRLVPSETRRSAWWRRAFRGKPWIGPASPRRQDFQSSLPFFPPTTDPPQGVRMEGTRRPRGSGSCPMWQGGIYRKGDAKGVPSGFGGAGRRKTVEERVTTWGL